MPRKVRCSICGARPSYVGYERRMAWLRRHRKKSSDRVQEKRSKAVAYTKEAEELVSRFN
jgi:hypothetical protein